MKTYYGRRDGKKFQFHKGTIRTTASDTRLLQYADFNSIKVQLEQVAEDGEKHDDIFQFHKGTIRTPEKKQKRLVFFNFNSIKVQLEL